MDLFQADPGSTSGLHLYTTNWPASWQLRFFVVSLSLFQSFVSFKKTTVHVFIRSDKGLTLETSAF